MEIQVKAEKLQPLPAIERPGDNMWVYDSLEIQGLELPAQSREDWPAALKT
jgi:hypothetical protein